MPFSITKSATTVLLAAGASAFVGLGGGIAHAALPTDSTDAHGTVNDTLPQHEVVDHVRRHAGEEGDHAHRHVDEAVAELGEHDGALPTDGLPPTVTPMPTPVPAPWSVHDLMGQVEGSDLLERTQAELADATSRLGDPEVGDVTSPVDERAETLPHEPAPNGAVNGTLGKVNGATNGTVGKLRGATGGDPLNGTGEELRDTAENTVPNAEDTTGELRTTVEDTADTATEKAESIDTDEAENTIDDTLDTDSADELPTDLN